MVRTNTHEIEFFHYRIRLNLHANGQLRVRTQWLPSGRCRGTSKIERAWQLDCIHGYNVRDVGQSSLVLAERRRSKTSETMVSALFSNNDCYLSVPYVRRVQIATAGQFELRIRIGHIHLSNLLSAPDDHDRRTPAIGIDRGKKTLTEIALHRHRSVSVPR